MDASNARSSQVMPPPGGPYRSLGSLGGAAYGQNSRLRAITNTSVSAVVPAKSMAFT